MIPIKEFVRDYFEEYGRQYQRPDDLIDLNIDRKNWYDILGSGGYIQVKFPNTDWNLTRQVAAWCRENFGVDHYYWTGGVFWFDSEEQAVLFALRWR